MYCIFILLDIADESPISMAHAMKYDNILEMLTTKFVTTEFAGKQMLVVPNLKDKANSIAKQTAVASISDATASNSMPGKNVDAIARKPIFVKKITREQLAKMCRERKLKTIASHNTISKNGSTLGSMVQIPTSYLAKLMAQIEGLEARLAALEEKNKN